MEEKEFEGGFELTVNQLDRMITDTAKDVLREELKKEGFDDVWEWKPGIYVFHTPEAWEYAKEEAKKRDEVQYYASTPEWIKEINRRHVDAIRHSNPNIEKYI